LAELGLTLERSGPSPFPGYNKTFRLDHHEEPDGPLNDYWSVSRAMRIEAGAIKGLAEFLDAASANARQAMALAMNDVTGGDRPHALQEGDEVADCVSLAAISTM
jgi:hypothetical protein